MITRMIKFIKKLRALHAIGKDGYLVEIGWFNSFIANKSINAKDEAIPWIAYPAIDFIASRVTNSMKVFEFGAGSSTLWWSRRVRHIDAVENNSAWFEFIKSKQAKNTTLHLVNGDEYFSKISELNKKYDIIVIDGLERNRCIDHALSQLTGDGIIIWDDSQREEYNISYDKLYKQGFKRIFFTGLSPVYNNKVETSIFYRTNNCFGI